MKNKALGILIALIGVFLLLINLNLLTGNIFLLLISAIFLLSYYRFNRNIGFLIPGCILLSISIFNILEGFYNINTIHILTFIGIGFILIFLIHYSGRKEISTGEKYWSLYPGTILISLGILISIIQNFPEYIRFILPLLLIVIGILLILRSLK